ncbi:HD domain-containing phosphohydrolase [Thauera chlorobenzoica]|uniref:Response regulator n=1 Tax=Thauera chlorobenzoica TaxID=96773 RepID=A0A1H5VRY9_9RHOO|nr:HD domain-containing phosphohydrolase [Thauera chlorobenzoica]APR03897.1 Response regulator [Thauera chlorobenzoica]SEF90095.1 putative two-component system response regulator [Thauera chlorobenzoica]
MNVVIVDDTPLNLTLMTKLIGRLPGAIPVPFDSALEGLAWCDTSDPDLVIVDYRMPGMDGLEFIRQLRARRDRDDLPILMVTASDDRRVRYEALEYGANDFLTKPFDTHEFEPRVRNMLKLRDAHLATRQRAASLAAEVRRATAAILERERETITRLARAAEFRDPETGAHIQRMSHYSALIARALGYPEEFAEAILMAAPMHDVGKLGIPDDILLKAGKLSADEFAVMQRHPRIGYDILKDSSSSILRLGATIALSHHEKLDGSGYPQGLAGEAIPLAGRIVAVADVFDALTSVRPYKPAWRFSRAVALLRTGRGSHFDPRCVDAFLHRWSDVLAIHARFRDPPARSGAVPETATPM